MKIKSIHFLGMRYKRRKWPKWPRLFYPNEFHVRLNHFHFPPFLKNSEGLYPCLISHLIIMKLYYNIITEYDWNDKTCIIIIIVQVLEPDDGIISQPYLLRQSIYGIYGCYKYFIHFLNFQIIQPKLLYILRFEFYEYNGNKGKSYWTIE